MDTLDTYTNIKIYVNILDLDEPSLLLKRKENNLDFIKGKIKKVDPSCIFSATRIFIKRFYNIQDVNHS